MSVVRYTKQDIPLLWIHNLLLTRHFRMRSPGRVTFISTFASALRPLSIEHSLYNVYTSILCNGNVFFIPQYGLQHAKMDFRTFAQSVVSDQPAQSGQANLKRHFQFFMFFFFFSVYNKSYLAQNLMESETVVSDSAG